MLDAISIRIRAMDIAIRKLQKQIHTMGQAFNNNAQFVQTLANENARLKKKLDKHLKKHVEAEIDNDVSQNETVDKPFQSKLPVPKGKGL